MKWLIISKNNLFFVFLIFGYVFGVMLYDFIRFDFTDEIMALFLLLFTGIVVYERRSLKEIRPLLVVSGIFAFYVCYSFIIQSNTPVAIIQDAIIQYKPYLAFFCVLALRPHITKKQKKVLVFLCLSGSAYLFIAASMHWYDELFGHPSRFATAAIITGLLYYYSTSFDWKDILVFFLIVLLSIASTRSKTYGFSLFTIIYLILIKSGYKFRFNASSIILLSILIIGMIWVAWDKIAYYFIEGTSGEAGSREMFARPALYLVSGAILFDYFPFGSGFASFATFISGESYSKIYYEYGLNGFWGLSPGGAFFASDTFYPSLAQYGLVGILLFIGFWYYVIHYANIRREEIGKLYVEVILICLFFLIESTSDSTFTHNRGMYALILLAMSLTTSTIRTSKTLT